MQSSTKTFVFACLLTCSTGLASSLAHADIYAPSDCLANNTQPKKQTGDNVKMCIGQPGSLVLQNDVATVIIGDENIVTVSALSKRNFTIIPRKFGRTNIEFYSGAGNSLGAYNINVRGEVQEKKTKVIKAPSTKKEKRQYTIMVEALGRQVMYRCVGACERVSN
jgi:Flp pilus assembly secretin CpaC